MGLGERFRPLWVVSQMNFDLSFKIKNFDSAFTIREYSLRLRKLHYLCSLFYIISQIDLPHMGIYFHVSSNEFPLHLFMRIVLF